MGRLSNIFVNSIVAIDYDLGEYKCFGTGFLYTYVDEELGSKATFVVSNRHVLDRALDSFRIRANPTTGHAVDVELKKVVKGEDRYMDHLDKNIDIAVVEIDPAEWSERGLEAQGTTSWDALDTQGMRDEWNIGEGDTVFTFGFPDGDAGTDRVYPIARAGCVARVASLYHGTYPYFSVDAAAFPGNSGGPVVALLEDQDRPTTAKLVGVVYRYVPYFQELVPKEDVGKPNLRVKMTIEHNTGLADVIPMDRVNETIARYLEGKRSFEALIAEGVQGEEEVTS